MCVLVCVYTDALVTFACACVCVDQKPMHFEDLPLSSIHLEKLRAELIGLKATEEGAKENPLPILYFKKRKKV